MKLFGWELQRATPIIEAKQTQFEDVLMRLVAAQQGHGFEVTPENCMRSPTVQAIVTAISRRISVSPLQIYKKTAKDGREAKEKLPNHPVAKLLAAPNDWQTHINYWLDATSTLCRWGNFYAYKARGSTGPIRALIPLHSRAVDVRQDYSTYKVTYHVTSGPEQNEYDSGKIHHVRGPARNFFKGDSPVNDVSQAIALEIAAEQFGSSFFNNGALPLLIFKYAQGSKGFKTNEDEKKFVDDFQNAFGGNKRHRAMLLPFGVDAGVPISVENDKAQMLETRKYQRTVIAAAWGVPPHLVGDLERGTFNNVEQQDSDFTSNVVMPIARQFESAMEADLLTDVDRNSGIVIRFNLDAILRADFKSRQEGLKIQREDGIISPNEWREIEGRNPIDTADGGDEYIRPANMQLAGQAPPAPATQKEPSMPTANGLGKTISEALSVARQFEEQRS